MIKTSTLFSSLSLPVLGLPVVIAVLGQPLAAQIVPDATLGSENSRLTARDRDGADQIEGGARRGANLFHSFQEFNVNQGQQVFFLNPGGVENIITRVTGDQPTRIEGTLGVSGNANLFFLNPNGIHLGRNANLDLSGSFVASTGSHFTFSNGEEYNAIRPQTAPLLTISAPIGLNFGTRPGDLTNEADFFINTSRSSDRLLILHGGVVRNNGFIGTRGGTARLIAANDIRLGRGSLISTDGGNVLLRAGGEIRFFDASVNASPPSLLADETSGNGGEIRIQARGNISLLNGSNLFSSPIESITGDPGSISINSLGEIRIRRSIISNDPDGDRSRSSILEIHSESLFVTSGSIVSASVSGSNRAGDIRIRTTEQVVLNGASIDSGTNLDSTGNGGNIRIETNRLIVRDGGRLSTESFGSGQGGQLMIRAAELVRLDGASPDSEFSQAVTEIAAGTQGRGRAGNLLVSTGRLVIEHAEISATTSGRGNAGRLTINANSIQVGRAGRITTTVGEDGQGQGGDLIIRAQEISVLDGGEIDSGSFGAGDAGRLVIHAGRLRLSGNPRTGLFTQSDSSGDAGDLEIKAEFIQVGENARISVSNTSTGDPGNLSIRTGGVLLNRGRLEAATASGEGANIDLDAAGFLLMRDRSQISAEARNNASGGNVIISAGFVVANPNSDNDIIANAVRGDGGRITIGTRAILGLKEESQNSRTNDIDASSEFGTSGTVVINQPFVNPGQGLVELPTTVVDASRQINQTCPTGVTAEETNRFVQSGRGGLPTTPADPLDSQEIHAEWYTPTGETAASTAVMSSDPSEQIIEAQGWVKYPDGVVEMVAATPSDGSNAPAFGPVSCHE